MNITTLVNQYYNNTPSAGSKVSKKEKGVEKLVQSANILSEGQIFEGTVSHVKGNRVTLSLSNGQSVDARLTGKVDLSEGQSLFFEVKSSTDTEVQIRPFSSDVTNNPTLLDALSQAGLDVNEKNLSMVNDMMKNSLPIDSSSLNEMARALMLHSNADVESILTLQRNNLPVTDNMIEQLQIFKSEQNSVLDLVNDISSSIPDALLSQNVSADDAMTFLTEISNMLSDNVSISEKADVDPGIISEETADGPKIAIADAAAKGTDSATVSDDTESISDAMKKGTTVIITDDFVSAPSDTENINIDIGNGDVINDPSKEQAVSDTVKAQDVDDLANAGKVSEDYADDTAVQTENVTLSLFSEEALSELPADSIYRNYDEEMLNNIAAALNDFKDTESVKSLLDENGVLRADVSNKDIYGALLNAVKESGNDSAKANLSKLLKADGFKDLISSLLSDKYSMDPAKLKDPENVKNFFKKTAADMSLMKNMADSMFQTTDNPIGKSANLIQNNINFVNEVNQNIAYIQLPIRLSGQNSTTDLYVYTNKKKGNAEDDEVSAFLHFDLEHLGSTDISVKMRMKNVTTKFFMEDDESYELIKNNMHILESRLRNLGYNAKIDIENSTDKHNIVTDVLEKDMNTGSKISRYSFDVRA